MTRINLTIIGRYFLLLSVVFLTNCEENNTSVVSTTTFTNTPSTLVSQNNNAIATHSTLNGTWDSFNVGAKSKWVFDKDVLSKTNIYSFGEVNEAQKYSVSVLDDYNGNPNDYGDYILLVLEGSESEKGICYKIMSKSANKVTLKSKGGHTVELTK